jgi:hypothetical protein
MLRRLGLGFTVIMLFQAVVLPAQDENTAEGGGQDAGENFFLFPVHVPLQTAAGGRVEWRPDWPANVPVDAFSILNDDGTRRVSALTLDGGEISLTARRDGQGALSEFPVFLNGGFYQFSTNLDPAGKVNGFTMNGENPLEIELLAFENTGGEPSLARIHSGESWFFASILYQDALILETWYDADGNPLAVFTSKAAGGGAIRRPASYRSVFGATSDGENSGSPENEVAAPDAVPATSESRLYFDGMGNTTLIDTDGAVFEALYNGAGPRYWKQPDLGHVALQWDEAGRLVRMAGMDRDDQPLDYRYEYKFDRQGAWTERLEIRMTPELDVLLPVPGDSFRRTIEYR